MHDVIVVGSGASGAWAAWQAVQRGLRVLMLDVGIEPKPLPRLQGNVHDLLQTDAASRDYLLGEAFENLHNIHRPYSSPKLKTPRFGFVTERARELSPITDDSFDALQTFAYGGLTNAWGAGAYRFTDADLDRFPIAQADLDPYFDTMTEQIGISGDADDLLGHFGSPKGIQPPLALDRMSSRFYAHYGRHRARFHRRGVRIGRPRLAILSEPLAGREACAYDNLSFWEPNLPYIYNPRMTVDPLREAGAIDYAPGHRVDRFEGHPDHVAVLATSTDTQAGETFEARTLILAAGAIDSARIVLQAYGDTDTRQPMLNNPQSLIPYVDVRRIGAALDRDSHGLTQLNVVYRGPKWPRYVQGSFYGYTAPLAADVFMDFPLSFRANRVCCKHLLPAFGILMFFYPNEPSPHNYVQLRSDGRLAVRWAKQVQLGPVEKHLIATFRRSGLLTHHCLVKYVDDQGSHRAGTLPMTDDDGVRYRVDTSGKLCGTDRVYVADGSVFPDLPSKNPTFTMMAIAMRVADAVADTLEAAR